MQPRRTVFRSAAAAAVGLLVVIAGAQGASADSSITLKLPDPKNGGQLRLAAGGTFAANDEIFAVIDDWPDGHSAVIEWTASSKSQYFRCWNNNGAGSAAKVCDEDIKEGARVSWRLCTGEYASNRLLNCTGWLVDYA